MILLVCTEVGSEEEDARTRSTWEVAVHTWIGDSSYEKRAAGISSVMYWCECTTYSYASKAPVLLVWGSMVVSTT